MWIVIALINISVIAALAFLAWHFGKWWIILFAPLLMMGYKQKGSDDE